MSRTQHKVTAIHTKFVTVTDSKQQAASKKRYQSLMENYASELGFTKRLCRYENRTELMTKIVDSLAKAQKDSPEYNLIQETLLLALECDSSSKVRQAAAASPRIPFDASSIIVKRLALAEKNETFAMMGASAIYYNDYNQYGPAGSDAAEKVKAAAKSAARYYGTSGDAFEASF